MPKGVPNHSKTGQGALADGHAMSIKIPEADYRTLVSWAKAHDVSPTSKVRTLVSSFCAEVRNLASHGKS